MLGQRGHDWKGVQALKESECEADITACDGSLPYQEQVSPPTLHATFLAGVEHGKGMMETPFA